LKTIDSNQNTVFSPALNVLATPLPVTWQSFSARMGSNGRITLDWATASEMNALHFEVQRSNDSRNFETVKVVNATGNSPSSSFYKYEEEFLPKGIYYYRLKEVDVDGQSDMTRIVSVRVEGNETVRVFPNPASDLLTVESAQALNRIEIFNSAGKLVQSAQTGEKAIRLNIAELPKGLYVISVDGRDLKIVK